MNTPPQRPHTPPHAPRKPASSGIDYSGNCGMQTPARILVDEFDNLDIMNFDDMQLLTAKCINPHNVSLYETQILQLGDMHKDMYFTEKFNSNVQTAKTRIENNPNEAEGHDIIYIKDETRNHTQWFELKIPQNIIIFGGAFCPPHKGHFETIEKVYPYYDHIIIAIQDESEERHGYTYDTIQKIWTIYKNQLLPDNGHKISFYKAPTDAKQEPFMSAYNYVLTEFSPGVRMIRFQIPNSRIDILMGPDNKRYIQKYRWIDWIQRRLGKQINRMIPLISHLWKDWFEFDLTSDFVVPKQHDSIFHATEFVKYIERQDRIGMMNFLPEDLSVIMQEKVLDILLSERQMKGIPWAKGSGPKTMAPPFPNINTKHRFF